MPVVTVGVAVAAVLLHAMGWGDAMQLTRGGDGVWVTWLTGHLAHWSWGHLGWDVVALLVLGAAAISAAWWVALPGQWAYRGLSGLGCGLLGLVLAQQAAAAWRGEPAAPLWASAAVAVGLLAKTGYEAATGATLFVDHATAGFTPVPLAHLVGAAVGLAVGAAWTARRAYAASPPG